jgi:hypothetical protein
MSNEKQFIDGLIFKKPKEGAPAFIKGSISIKVEELKAFLDKHQSNGWVNIDLKESQGNKYYAELNTWKPEQKPNNNQAEQPQEDINVSGIPF